MKTYTVVSIIMFGIENYTFEKEIRIHKYNTNLMIKKTPSTVKGCFCCLLINDAYKLSGRGMTNVDFILSKYKSGKNWRMGG